MASTLTIVAMTKTAVTPASWHLDFGVGKRCSMFPEAGDTGCHEPSVASGVRLARLSLEGRRERAAEYNRAADAGVADLRELERLARSFP